jgi:hypothetical protein
MHRFITIHQQKNGELKGKLFRPDIRCSSVFSQAWDRVPLFRPGFSEKTRPQSFLHFITRHPTNASDRHPGEECPGKPNPDAGRQGKPFRV